MSHDAKREAEYRCPATCSKVGQAIWTAIQRRLLRSDWLRDDVELSTVVDDLSEEAFSEAKAHGTEPLRAALIEAEDERLTAQRELRHVREEVDSLRSSL